MRHPRVRLAPPRSRRRARPRLTGRGGSSTSGAWGLLAIAVVALVLRIVFLSGASHHPVETHLELDPAIHDANAWALASGQDPEPGPYFRAPLYTHALALVYSLAGHSPNAARLAQAALGALTVLLIGWIAARLGGTRAGWIAAALAAVYPPLVFFTGELVSATLEVALTAASLYLTLRAGDRPRAPWIAAAAGFALSLSAITRPTVLPFAIAAAVWLMARGAGTRSVALYLAAALSLPLAVTARNAIVGKDAVFIASQGGINFYVGNHAGADGTTPDVPGAGSGMGATHDAPARIASAAMGRALKPSEVSSYWFGRGVDFWVKRPLQATRLYVRKVLLVWNRRELPNVVDQQFFAPAYSWLYRVPIWPGFAILAPIALAVVWRERGRGSLLLLYLATTTAATAAFFVCDRFRLPLVLGVIPLAALGIDRVVSVAAEARSRGASAPVHLGTAAALLAAFAVVWLPFPRLQRTQTGMSWYRVARAETAAGNMQGARDAYKNAERAGFSTPMFFNEYGLYRMENHDSIGAESLFRRALERNSRFGPAHANLAELYFRRETYDMAAQEYAIAATLIPERAAELWVNAGTVYEGLGQRDRALQCYGEALRATPGFEAAVEGERRVLSASKATR
jgi:4-amino-4-deoxy-L-arabinose transferase-like glycosyltransferase